MNVYPSFGVWLASSVFFLLQLPLLAQAPASPAPEGTKSMPSSAKDKIPVKELEGSSRSSADMIIVPDLQMTLLPIAPGSFVMGSEHEDSDAKPLTKVTLTRPFWLGRTEVTVGQFKAFVDASAYHTDAEKGGGMYGVSNGYMVQKADATWRSPGFNQDESHPVVGISWDDAMAFCHWLTSRERAAGKVPAGYEYTLPTEAQWEYACRAGTAGDYAGVLESMAWFRDNSEGRTHSVAQKQANAFGLFDMHGNAAEWCADWYGDYPGGSVQDPKRTALSWACVFRGGSWQSLAPFCRSASRNRFEPSRFSSDHSWSHRKFRFFSLGFRVALSPTP